MFKARAHAGTRGEMDNLVKIDGGKNFVERSGVGDVAVDEFKWLGERLDVAEIMPFEVRIVEIVEVVERPDGVAVMQQPFANVRADEARAAGDQEVHGQKLTGSGRSVERAGKIVQMIPSCGHGAVTCSNGFKFLNKFDWELNSMFREFCTGLR